MEIKFSVAALSLQKNIAPDKFYMELMNEIHMEIGIWITI